MSSIKRTGLILLLIILLPAAIFTWIEISSLSSTEQIIEKIYNNQLESVLYSVNQFSEDVVSSWVTRIETASNNTNYLSGEDSTKYSSIKTLLKNESSAEFVFFTDNNNIDFILSKEASLLEKYRSSSLQILQKSQSKIKRLISYGKEGYRKAEPIAENTLPGIVVVLSLVNSSGKNQLCGIGINANSFIKQVLGPKIQQTSQNEFLISVFNSQKKENVYSTGTVNLSAIENERALWLFPEYNIGIMLKGGTIRDLVRSRSETNLILIVMVLAILLIGVWFVFRNVRKEVRLAQIKSEFVSNVSHELRTPLALITMFAETLEMGRVRTDEKRNEYYTIISQEAGRLSKIVNRILNFSQMEAGKRKFHYEKIDINCVVEGVYKTYKFHLENNGFKFSFSPDEDLPLINGDKEALAEALINLLDNAAKYSGDVKAVELSTGRMGELVYIKVKDSGIGISEQDQKKIFEKFFRVPTGDVHNIKGTGLGLTLVKHIVEAHKGEITLHSTVGRGSAFILKFRP